MSKAGTVELTGTAGSLELETELSVTGTGDAAAGGMGGANGEDRAAMPGGGMTEATGPGEANCSTEAAGVPGRATGADTTEGTAEGAA